MKIINYDKFIDIQDFYLRIGIFNNALTYFVTSFSIKTIWTYSFGTFIAFPTFFAYAFSMFWFTIRVFWTTTIFQTIWTIHSFRTNIFALNQYIKINYCLKFNPKKCSLPFRHNIQAYIDIAQ